SAAMAFLRPATNRPNLTVLTDAPVARLTIEDSRATGVELIDGRHLSANGEVLLCAGTIVSPKILMQSGIGDAAELKAVGIEPIANLPGVGKNLQDHAASAVIMRTKSRTPWGFSWAKAPSLAFDALRYLTARKGFFAAQLIESGGFIKTSPDLDRPDIQFVFVPGHRAPPPKVIEVGHGYSCFAVLLRPKSRGTVTLASADPAAAPVIDPCFYTEEEDMKLMLKALKENRRLTNADAFKKYEPYEVMPGDKVQSDDALEEYIRNTGGTIFHPVGTCKMGRDDTAVVDERLRVYGLDGLRIVDASIMPLICGGNTNAPVIMFGEKASDMIKEDAGRAVRLGTGNIAPSESRAA
ncbi:MAG: GMC oxidoreductase, partial [Alphaproteobacteria bacterium]|nr:GMC oxidoreductase [Alphaproteobacteria bacterium]